MQPEAPLLDVGSTEAMGVDRKTRVLSRVRPGSKVIEIGGSYSPMAPRSAGFDTFTLDHAPHDELVDYYRKFGVPTDTIEPVDFVCTDGNFDAAVPPEHLGTFDVCISSHNLEHYPNPIRSLQAISRLLTPDGVASFAIPDRRGCFDFFRPLTTAGSWLESYLTGATRHRLQTIFDMEAYVVALDGVPTWHQTLPLQSFSFAGKSLQQSYEEIRSLGPQYRDAHNSVFTPSSFQLLIREIQALGLVDLFPVKIDSNSEVEFYVDLVRRPCTAITPEQRMTLLKRLAREQVQGWERVT